jgi:hypothetical protein
MNAPRLSQSWGYWLREAAGSLVVSVFYLGALEVLARVFLHDPAEVINPRFAEQMHGWVTDPRTAPALCRWDCGFYVNMATSGYPGQEGDAVYNTAFFPLFGLVTRWVAIKSGMTAAYAAVWISRVCLPVSVSLLRDYVRLSGGAAEAGWAAVAVFLLTPGSYIMGAGVAEGLFVALTLTTMVLAKRGHLALAMVPAFLAGLTRVHAFAFLGGLIAFGVSRQSLRPLRLRRPYALAPALACALGLGALMAYQGVTTSDPLAFIHLQARFGKPTFNPVGALRELAYYARITPPETTWDFLQWVRLPVAVGIFGSTLYFYRQRRWFECAYTGGLNAMLLLSSYWGVLRYMPLVFPVPIALGELRRYRGLWYGLLVSATLCQAYLLLQFVMLRRSE